MSNIDKRALRHSAESIICILENIAGFEPSDIDGDSVELRFETEDGFDTGCDVSIVDQCQKTADVVRALLDELERNQQYIKSRDQENEDIALTVGRLRVEMEAAEKRIAELSASHSKLRDTMAGIYNTIRMDGGYTPLAAILNAAKRAYEESASAAGIRIKGE
ncbi:ead/Ea22-like family protein [Escherichia coli]|nr:ead/Ea22-like family protein [Escherichia coli]EEW1885796.1 ead/Ea22-like family protein [Escherichia coli]EFC4215252.1 ead/Ea22-like family protein [Escherichia coli]EFH6524430.1 ead/Ea22-like family protein [Escherichia coli]EFL7011572.1 ead/Ea22-like family protein [Escherichia coli]